MGLDDHGQLPLLYIRCNLIGRHSRYMKTKMLQYVPSMYSGNSLRNKKHFSFVFI